MARNKYNARKITRNGSEIDSKAEGKRYQELKLLERAGEISDLRCHPRFRLIDGQDHNGAHYYPCNYTADFQYTENGKTIVEDVKSKATQTTAFMIRLKIWLTLHDEDLYEFRIVKG